MKRIILYASVYAGIGAVIGVLMALYTQDVTPDMLLSNSNHQNPVAPSDNATAKKTEVTQNG